MSDTLRVLDIGAGKHPVETEVLSRVYGRDPEDFEVTTLDVDAETEPDVLHDIREPLDDEYHEAFQVLWFSHVLEHFRRYDAVKVLANAREALDEMGEAWVWVPSLEWCAQEILSDHPSPVVLSAIYGSQDNEHQFHKNGYTLRGLRYVLSHAGFIPRHVFHTNMVIRLQDENGEVKEWSSLQNVAVGLKYEAPESQLGMVNPEASVEEVIGAERHPV